MKIIQTLKKNEWIENSSYIAQIWNEIFNFYNTNNNFEVLTEDKDFCDGLIKLFKFIHVEFKLQENDAFLYPTYYLLYFMEILMKSRKFQDVCIDNKLIEFLLENYLNNQNFPDQCFLENSVELSFGPILNFQKYKIYEMFLYCLDCLLVRNINYTNFTFINELNHKIFNIKRLTNYDPVQYNFILRFLNIQLHFFNEKTIHKWKIEKSIFCYIFSFLKQYLTLPADEQFRYDIKIQLTLAVLRNYTNLSQNLNELLERKTMFLDFLLNFNFQFYDLIVDCILSFIYSRDFLPENQPFLDKFRSITKTLDEKHGNKLRKIIHYCNETINLKKRRIFSSSIEKKHSISYKSKLIWKEKHLNVSMFFFKGNKVIEKNAQNISCFLNWDKQMWKSSYHQFSTAFNDILQEFENSSFSFTYFENVEFGKNISKIFNKLHTLFFTTEGFSDFQEMFNNLYHFIDFVIFLTDYFEILNHELINENSLSLIIKQILKSNFFKFDKLFEKLPENDTWFSDGHRIDILKDYLLIVVNNIKFSSTSFHFELEDLHEEFKHFLKSFKKYLDEKRLYPDNSDPVKVEETCQSLSVICFIAEVWLLEPKNSDELESNLNLKLNFSSFEFLCKTLLTNLQIKHYDLNFTIENDELLKIFIGLSKNFSNLTYFKHIFKNIFTFFNDEWEENIQISAAQLIYCLISNEDIKNSLLNDKKLLYILLTPSNINSKKTKHLKQNIFYKLNLGILNDNCQIVINSYHSINSELRENIIEIIENTIQASNLLLIDSRRKF